MKKKELIDELDKIFDEPPKFKNPIDEKAKKKAATKKIAGFFLFEIWIVVALLNFFMGGFFSIVMYESHKSLVIWAVLLCFINSITFFGMALESYFVHVAGKKKKGSLVGLEL